LLQRKIAAENCIEVIEQKIGVLVIEQYQQIYGNDKGQEDFLFGLAAGFVHKSRKEIVYHAGQDEQRKKHAARLVVEKQGEQQYIRHPEIDVLARQNVNCIKDDKKPKKQGAVEQQRIVEVVNKPRSEFFRNGKIIQP
jgi:hypothetical protein